MISIFLPALAFAAPKNMTYQGRILKADGTPLENNNVSFIFQIMDPLGQCMIYQERVDGIDMTNSGGVFDVPIGNGSVMYPTTGSFSVLDSFNNDTPFTCSGGSPYTPTVSDGRILRVQFYDGVGWKTISPDNVIRTIPYAAYSYSASKLGTNIASDFVIKTGIPSCGAGNFLTWNGTAFSCGLAGTGNGTVTSVTSSNSYLSVADSTVNPILTVNVGTGVNTVAAGNDSRIVNALQTNSTAGGDLSGTYPNPSVAKLQGVAVASSAPISGNFLKYNGTNWVGSFIGISDVSGLSTTLSGYVSQSQLPSNCAANQTLTFSSPTGAFTCSTISIFGSQVSGNITGNAAGFTGSLGGDVTGTQGATKVVALQNQAVSATAPNNNEVLEWNGSSWTPTALPVGNSGTVTSVSSANLDIGVATGTTTPVLTLNSGTGANQILKLDGSAKIPAVDGSQITNLNPANLSSVVPVAKGGTGQSSYTDGQLLIGNSTGNTLTKATLTAGSGVSITNGSGAITIATTGAAPTGTASGDLSGTYPAPTVAKINGIGLTYTSIASGQFLKYNGSAWINAVLTSSDIPDLSTTYMTNSAFSTDVASASCTSTQTMYWSSVSSKFLCQSITGFTGSLAGDVTGTQGATKVVALQNQAVAVTAPNNNEVLEWNGSAWTPTALPAGNAGSVTSVTSANSDISIANTTTTPVLTLNTGTGANQILKLDSSSKIPAVDGSQITNLNPANLSTVVPVAKGGTGQSTYTDGQLLIGNTTGNTLTKATLTAGTGVSITNGNGAITIATTGAAPTGSASGDLSGTYPAPTVAKIQNTAVSATAPTTSQVLVYSGTQYAPVSISSDATIAATGALTLKNTGTAGTYGSATTVPVVTTDAQGRVTGVVNTTIAGTAPGGSASGDLSGTYPAPTVAKIQGTAVSSTAPTTSQILVYSGTQYAPVTMSSDATIGSTGILSLKNTGTAGTYGSATTVPVVTTDAQGRVTGVVNTTIAGTAPGGSASGDLSGTYPAPTVAKIQGTAVSSTAPTTSQILVYSGTQYAPVTMSSDATIGSTGVLSLKSTGTAGTYGSASTVPVFTTDAQGRVTGVTNTTITGTSPGGTAGGDLSGTYPNPTVAKIQGTAVSSTAPSATGQVLRYNGTQYVATKLIYTDLVNSFSATPWPSTTCSTGQAVTWSSTTDSFTCSTISLSASNFPSQAANTFLAAPNGTTGAPTFRVIASADLPTAGTAGTYGSASTVPVFTTDAYGRVTSVTNTTIAANATDLTGIVPVVNGGTGQSTYTNGQLLIGNTTGNTLTKATLTAGTGISITNGTGAITIATTGAAPTGAASGDLSGTYPGPTVAKIQGTAVSATAPTTSQLLIYSGSQYAPVSMSSDATISAAGALTLKNTGTAGTYGSATTVPVFTTDAQGRVTAVTNTTITGTAPGGTAGGDLSGTYPNPVVAKIQGIAVSTTDPTTAQLLVYSGTQYAPVSLSSDATISAAGALTLKNTGTAGTYGSASTVPVLTTDAQGRVTGVTNTAITASATSLSGIVPIANGGTGAATTTAHYVFIGPTSGTGAPSFRALAAADLPSGTLAGSGTAGYIPYYSAASTLADSSMFMSSTNIGIANTSPAYPLDVTGIIRGSSEIISTSANAFRMVQGNYGSFFRNDGGSTYLLLTASGDQYGSWNTLRPFSVSDSTGLVSIGNGLAVTAGNATVTGNITASGNIQATSFTSTSDRRLKTNIVTAPGLSEVMKLRGVHFNWKKDGVGEYGVIAQEVEQVFPELVVNNEVTGYKAVKYIGLIGPLIEATKDLSNKCDMSAAQIQQLQASVEAVQQDVQTIKRRLASVEDENAQMKVLLKAMDSRIQALETKKQK